MPQKGSRVTALQKRAGINRDPAAPRHREAARANYLDIQQRAADRRPSSKGCWGGFPSRAANASQQPFQNLIRTRRRRSISECAIHRSFKRRAATSHAQHMRFAMTTSAKTLTALAAAATLGLAAFATAQPAQANQHHGHHHHHRHFVFFAPAPVYAYSAPYGCYWTRQRVWDGWGWHQRRVRVCV